MLPPLIRRRRYGSGSCSAGLPSTESRANERGVTMALVALGLLSMIAMAALAIDIGTLYVAKAEAQRAADAAALSAARLISMEGITGDPTNTTSSWQQICGGSNNPAAAVATVVAQKNLIGGVPVLATNVTVTYGAGKAGGTATDCSSLGSDFGVNPTVTVVVQSSKLPIFFARVFSLFGSNFSGTTVTGTATAEAFNSSDSGTVASQMIPVQPRCVKPWIVPNADPNSGNRFVHRISGKIWSPGVSQLGGGVIGETFQLSADCVVGAPNCLGANLKNNPPTGAGGILQYLPALVSGTPTAIASTASCTPAAGFQAAIAGCDQTTAYSCGTPNAVPYDLNENPVNPSALGGDTGTALDCLTHYKSGGEDQLLGYAPGTPPQYPFQIQAGLQNPLVQAGLVNNNDIITTSNSIVSIPIYDSNAPTLPAQVTVLGFLQVFINQIDGTPGPTLGNIHVTVLNVSGCSNNATATPVSGSSPVPIRLVTAP